MNNSLGIFQKAASSNGNSFFRPCWIMTAVLLSLFIVLPVAVAADTGPKPTIKIIVKNAPTETYYLDLLINEDQDYDNLSNERSQFDTVKLGLLEQYNQDGWFPALAHGTKMPLWGDLIGKRQGTDCVHDFGYFGRPERFKIIIITPDNQVSDYLKPPLDSTSFTFGWC